LTGENALYRQGSLRKSDDEKLTVKLYLQAAEKYQKALIIKENFTESHINLGTVLFSLSSMKKHKKDINSFVSCCQTYCNLFENRKGTESVNIQPLLAMSNCAESPIVRENAERILTKHYKVIGGQVSIVKKEKKDHY